MKLIDATPIGINVRSTVATYANVHDELRKIYAKTADAKEPVIQSRGFFLQYRKACAARSATEPGEISLDVQFLPDVDIPCPECRGTRYAKEAWQICYENKAEKKYSLPQLMEMDVHTALAGSQGSED